MLFKKIYEQSSVFTPDNLLREARRQKNIKVGDIPPVCLLDPDGDIVSYLLKTKQAKKDKYWACYHTTLYRFQLGKFSLGIIGRVVGSSFAVLIAEQLFVSGCKLLISMTSAGIIIPPVNDSRFILIESALRDEGTSLHYLPPDTPSVINPTLSAKLSDLFGLKKLSVSPGISWTTDAPYRETPASIEAARQNGANAVEMEASALYAFAIAKQKDVICFAHITNSMAQSGMDFEKGEEHGSLESLKLVHHALQFLYPISH